MRIGRWVFVLLLCAALGAAAGTAARADGIYFHESFGPGARVGNELAAHYRDGGFAGRASLGRRVGRWAIEATFLGSTLVDRDCGSGESSLVAFGAAARYFVPLSRHADAYLHGGLQRVQLMDPYEGSGSPEDYRGRGLDYGAGLQIGGRVPALALLSPLLLLVPQVWNTPKIKMGVVLDFTHEKTRLRRAKSPTLDGDLEIWTLGFAVGSDF